MTERRTYILEVLVRIDEPDDVGDIELELANAIEHDPPEGCTVWCEDVRRKTDADN